jgi:hypothetical protein
LVIGKYTDFFRRDFFWVEEVLEEGYMSEGLSIEVFSLREGKFHGGGAGFPSII